MTTALDMVPLAPLPEGDTRHPLNIRDPWERLQRLDQYYQRLIELNGDPRRRGARMSQNEIALATSITTNLLLHHNISQIVKLLKYHTHLVDQMAKEIRELKASAPTHITPGG